MVDINYTLLVQLANFLVLLFLLNILLFRPVLRHMADRDGKIGKSHEEAKENADRAEFLVSEFEHELAESRVKASQIYHSLQQEGTAEQRAKIAAAKAQSQDLVEKARKEIEGEAGRAREILKAEMERLPRDIAAKLLGRTV